VLLRLENELFPWLGQIFRYAIAADRAQRNPSLDLRGALPPVKSTHFASITNLNRVDGLLKAIDGYHGALVTRCARCSWRRSHLCDQASCARRSERISISLVENGILPASA
jgi:hypothetical protein